MSDQKTPGFRWLFALISVMLVTAMLLVAACGGDDDEEDDGGDDPPTATEQTDDGEDEEDEETPEADEEEEEDGGSGLSESSSNYSNFQGVVKYETTGFAEGSYNTLTIYRGDGGSRVDYEGSGSTGTFLTNDDGVFLCSDGQCVKSPLGDAVDPTAAFTAFISPEAIEQSYGNLPDGVNVEESSETIAGFDATCYEYAGDLDDSTEGDESGQICFSDSGILLRLDSTNLGGGKFEAVEAEEGTSGEDFEPPFPVTELPSFGQ
jgi:hypothetical protein